jgi:hypothetical protein
MYFRAALSYLDAGSLKDAREMLKAHRKLGPPDAAAGQFEQILVARTNPIGLSVAATNSESSPRLFRTSGTLDESFLKRQRFKIYADLAGNLNAGPAQLGAALEAYGLAVEQQSSLVGGSDLLRWQRVEATLLASANAQATSARKLTTNWSGTAPAKTFVRITLAGEDRPTAVIVRKETPVAAQVIRTAGVARIRDLQPYLRLHPEGIEVAPVPAGSDLAPSLDRIKRTPDIPLARKPTIVMPLQ